MHKPPHFSLENSKLLFPDLTPSWGPTRPLRPLDPCSLLTTVTLNLQHFNKIVQNA